MSVIAFYLSLALSRLCLLVESKECKKEPPSVPSDVMSVVSGAALVLFVDGLHLLEKAGSPY